MADETKKLELKDIVEISDKTALHNFPEIYNQNMQILVAEIRRLRVDLEAAKQTIANTDITVRRNINEFHSLVKNEIDSKYEKFNNDVDKKIADATKSITKESSAGSSQSVETPKEISYNSEAMKEDYDRITNETI